MRRNLTARRALLLALAFALPVSAGGGAQAVGNPAWIEQARFDPAIPDFNVKTVLYDPMRFPTANGQTQRPLGKYLAYGTMAPFTDARGLVLAQIGVAASDDGVHWGTPRGLTISDKSSPQDLPLIVNEESSFAVAYGDVPQFQNQGPARFTLQFMIIYLDAFSDVPTTDAADLHFALSSEGTSFTLDSTLSEGGAETLIGGGGFKAFTYGPSQLVLNRSAGTCAPADSAYPWNCQIAMVYDAADAADLGSVALAGSNAQLNMDGTLPFDGAAAPALNAAGGPAWDDAGVAHGQVLRIGSTYNLSYSGTDGTGAQLGLATSGNGKTYTAAGDPIVRRSLLESFGPDAPHSLVHPYSLAQDGRFFFTRITDAGQRDFFVANKVDPPTTAPKVQIFSPNVGPLHANSFDIDVCVSDTLGTTPGVNPATFSLKLDGATLTGYESQMALRCAIQLPALNVKVPNALTNLAVGDHEVEVSVADWDGNAVTVTAEFSIDRVAPDTILTVPGQSPQIDLPLSSIGYFEGETTDLDSPILGIKAIVTNPLRQQKVYEARFVDGKISKPANGFTFVKTESNGKKLIWRWVAPSLDLHTAIPGPYTISFVGFDTNNALELPDAENTTEVLFL